MAGANESRTPPADLLESLGRLCPEVGAEEARLFLSGLDPEYWDRESPEDVAAHLRLAESLSPLQPARVRVTPREEGLFDVAFTAFDYFGEFAMLCGLLAVHGLDITAGHVHTLPPRHSSSARGRGARPVATSRRILDIFRVRPRRSPPDAAALERELVELYGVVAEGQTAEARERLTLRLVETLERMGAPPPPEPVDVAFDNETYPSLTLLDVRGPDAPGFLHAFASALAIRGVYVHSVRIESRGSEVHDRFAVTDRDGRKIESGADQQALRVAVVLIHQFTLFLASAPDPARALRSFDQLLDRVLAGGAGEETLGLLRSPEGLRQLARLLGSSAFLWEDFLRAHFEQLRPLLDEWSSRPIPDRAALEAALRARLAGASTLEEKRRRLNEYKDEEMLLFDMKHLLDPAVTGADFERALTDLADVVVEEALEVARGRLVAEHGHPRTEEGKECGLALFGLGKYGGGEMGYASDIELLAAYSGPGRTAKTGLETGRFFEALVQELVHLIEARQDGIFHVDLRLRPHGAKGALASPLEALRDYYRPGGGAVPFERQALIKLRFVTGDEALGRGVERLRDAFVWSEEPWDREDALHLRDRQVRELVLPGRFNVKLSRGAMVDVEYAVQYLQIRHGREHAELRTPQTLRALAALRALGLVTDQEHDDLREAYLFWRRVADALRMVRGNARDLLLPPEDSEELRSLARRLGYPALDRQEGARALSADVARHRERVASFFDRRFRS
jgi:[glutamine synthetase] adenylyltransferase / [glutamine synthetase]-adenylyl-L-tyrosine phosphorylase